MPHNPTAQTVIRAPESTENIPSARRVRDVSKKIQYLDPSAAPLTVLAKKARKQSAYNPKYEWIEKDLPARWDAINGTTGTGTAQTVDHGSYFSVGDIVAVTRTGERMLVTAVAGNNLTVARGIGTVVATAIADNDDLLIIGNAYQEGANAGAEKSHIETYPFNYTQIIRTPFGVTGTQDNSENYTGPDKPRLRAEKAIEHMIDIERTILFGERGLDTSTNGTTNNPRRYTGGFLYYATYNVKDFGGVMTEAELEDWCEDLFHYTGGSDTRFVAAAPLPISVMDMLGVARLELSPGAGTLGLSIKQYVTSHGTLNIVKHRLLEDGYTSGVGYGGYMLAVDPSKLAYRFLQNRDTKHRVDIQAPDLDGWKDEYMTEFGWQVENPPVHGVGKGITG